MDIIDRYRPALSKTWLHLLSGMMWTGVDVMLCSLAFGWLKLLLIGPAILLALCGCLLAFLINTYGFGKLASRNIKRIDNYDKEKICLFAFQQWSSYPLILVMVLMGIFLRHFSPFPKPLLAVGYLGIGGGLFLASLRYYSRIFSEAV